MRKLTTEEYIIKFKETHGDRYDYKDVIFKGSFSKVIIHCSIHGAFEQWPSDHRRGFGCSKCSGKDRGTTEEFIEKAKLIHGDFYDYSKVDFISMNKPIIVICPKHGVFLIPKAGWHVFGTKIGCAECKRSKGEVAIKEWLLKNNIPFEQQMRFIGFKNRSFDFYLPIQKLCIEFDGAQHFHSKHQRTENKIEAEKIFQQLKKRDEEKNLFCKTFQLRLLRIPYFKIKNINKILNYEILCNFPS